MIVTLYLDVYLAVNLLANLAVLGLVNRLLKLHGKRRRMFVAALFGAAAVCAGLVLRVAAGEWIDGAARRLVVIGRLLFLTGISAMMLRIAFGKIRRGDFGRVLAGFWMIAAAAGGCFEAVLFSGQRGFFCFLCCAAAVYCLGKAVILFLQRKQSLQKSLYEVTLHYRGKSTNVTALLDSGNRLYEPYGHQPVHVISKDAVGELCHSCDRVIYIPFSSVGTEHGMMLGVQIDEMDVKKDGQLIRRVERPWVAISRQPLSAGRQYEMLLHGEEE